MNHIDNFHPQAQLKKDPRFRESLTFSCRSQSNEQHRPVLCLERKMTITFIDCYIYLALYLSYLPMKDSIETSCRSIYYIIFSITHTGEPGRHMQIALAVRACPVVQLDLTVAIRAGLQEFYFRQVYSSPVGNEGVRQKKIHRYISRAIPWPKFSEECDKQDAHADNLEYPPDNP